MSEWPACVISAEMRGRKRRWDETLDLDKKGKRQNANKREKAANTVKYVTQANPSH